MQIQPEEAAQAIAYWVEVVIEQAGATTGLEGQAIGLVLGEGSDAIGFDIGEDFELARFEHKALGLEAFFEGNRQVEDADRFR